jgi:hypothetical protein
VAQLFSLGGNERIRHLSVTILMKTFNIKLGIIVFLTFVALYAACVFVSHTAYCKWTAIPWSAINLPGTPIYLLFRGFFVAGSSGQSFTAIGSELFSALFWSVAAGFIFRRKYAA